MKLRVALLPELLPSDWCDDNTIAIVIDTLRFTTTACQALAAGAASLQLAAEIDQALELAANCDGPKLLCGERSCRRIDGFDLGNSPHEYTPERVEGKTLIFTTTNGTRAAAAVHQAKRIYLGALVNRRAICNAIESSNAQQVWIVCAGTDGEVAFEDVLSAGAILDGMQTHPAGDAAWLAAAAWKELAVSDEGIQQRLLSRFRVAAGGRNLIDSGYANDLDFAVRLDALNTTPHSSRSGVVFESRTSNSVTEQSSPAD